MGKMEESRKTVVHCKGWGRELKTAAAAVRGGEGFDSDTHLGD